MLLYLMVANIDLLLQLLWQIYDHRNNLAIGMSM